MGNRDLELVTIELLKKEYEILMGALEVAQKHWTSQRKKTFVLDLIREIQDQKSNHDTVKKQREEAEKSILDFQSPTMEEEKLLTNDPQ